MKKIFFLIGIGILLSSCSYLRPSKMDIEQGNIILENEVNRLHPGMTADQVKAIMGTPVLIDLFSPQRFNYVYTYQVAYGQYLQRKIICTFNRGRLVEIKRYEMAS